MRPADEPSRREIAQSLASKDPSWFRQTPDRGIGSAAFRKSQGQDDEVTVNNNVHLPGMTQKSETSTPTLENEERQMPSSNSPARESGSWNNHVTGAAVLANLDGLKPPLPTSSSRDLELRDNAAGVGNSDPGRIAMSPSQGRLSPERPPSPTKGLGGFVQSAMLKRSDSVNKRWNVQTAPGLNRADSIASNRSSASTPRGYKSPQKESHISDIAPKSMTVKDSRPSSSHSNSTVQTSHESATLTDNAQPHRPSETSQISLDRTEQSHPQMSSTAQDSLPLSPTKTMDPKRWSPTKSSWLESALNKPESSRVKSPSVEQPPSWRTSLQRAKEGKGSIHANDPISIFREVATPGLLRSPPPGTQSRPESANGLPQGLTNSGAPLNNSQDKVNVLPSGTRSQGLDAVDQSEPAPKSTEDIKLNAGAEKSTIAVSTTEDRPDPTTEITPKPTVPSPRMSKKPETPQKPDFRANLRSRGTNAERGSTEDVEFKKVFGSLKRTETKNYVAPDELKNNILRGKAGLSITGGPKKTARVDDFKESILKQKEAMKAGGGSINKDFTQRPPATIRKPSPAMPEALHRKHQLGRSTSIRSDRSESEISEDGSGSTKSPQLNAMLPPSRPSLKQVNNGTDSQKYVPPTSRRSPANDSAATDIRAGRNAGTGSAPISGITADTGEPLPQPKQSPSLPTTTTPVQFKGEPKNGKLANRLNPALAGLISRGPQQSTLPGSKAGTRDLGQSTPTLATEPSAETKSGDTLTHATKARAKGPKRRLPNTVLRSTEDTVDKGSEQVETDKMIEGLNVETREPSMSKSPPGQNHAGLQEWEPETNKVTETEDRTKRRVPPPALPLKHVNLGAGQVSSPPQKGQVEEKEKPQVSAKSPALQEVSSSLTPRTSRPLISKPMAESPMHQKKSPSSTLSQVLPNRLEPVGERSNPSISSPQPTSHISSAVIGNGIEADSESLSAAVRQDPAPKSTKEVQSPGLKSLPKARDAHKSYQTMSNDAEVSSTHGKQNFQDTARSVPASKPTDRIATTTTNQYSPTSAASVHIDRFFDVEPTTQAKATFDTDKVLSSQGHHVQSQAQTIQVQVFQIDPSGKKIPMPPYKEHILFEDGMYLCVYTYHLPHKTNDRLSQVFLWVGDEVSEATFDDIQIFCRKIARESNAKLEILRQGKETPVFLQALNGVLIVRRSRADALYMLGTRMHMGYLAFDEVDFHPDSLCSGFPYLINAQYGKQLLWKGKGSSADELGIARLIGMDLGLTGEMEEIEEAAEPVGFFENFPQTRGSRDSVPVRTSNMTELWAKKPRSAAYCARLYRLNAEAERPTSSGFFWPRRNSSPPKDRQFIADIAEVSPFAQRDIEPASIYVLDAFFKIFV